MQLNVGLKTLQNQCLFTKLEKLLKIKMSQIFAHFDTSDNWSTSANDNMKARRILYLAFI